jgi:hypothetical protein
MAVPFRLSKTRDSRFWPIATLPQEFMSAMPPKADKPEPTRWPISDQNVWTPAIRSGCISGTRAIDVSCLVGANVWDIIARSQQESGGRDSRKLPAVFRTTSYTESFLILGESHMKLLLAVTIVVLAASPMLTVSDPANAQARCPRCATTASLDECIRCNMGAGRWNKQQSTRWCTRTMAQAQCKR